MMWLSFPLSLHPFAMLRHPHHMILMFLCAQEKNEICFVNDIGLAN